MPGRCSRRSQASAERSPRTRPRPTSRARLTALRTTDLRRRPGMFVAASFDAGARRSQRGCGRYACWPCLPTRLSSMQTLRSRKQSDTRGSRGVQSGYTRHTRESRILVCPSFRPWSSPPGPVAGCRHAAAERRQLLDLTDMRKNGLGIRARLVRSAQIFVILFDPTQADQGQNVRRHSGRAGRDSGGTSELECVSSHGIASA